MVRRTDAIETLTDLARTQDGFFATSQAVAKGVDRHQLQRLVSQRLLMRDRRGLYRLAPFPESDRADLWRAILWPTVERSDGPAVLSDGTALSLYEVTTINPSVTDIAVPRSRRLRREPPAGIRINRRDYDAADFTNVSGLPTTTLYRTLIDLVLTGRDLQFVDEALENARTKALLTSKELRRIAALRAIDDDLFALLRNQK